MSQHMICAVPQPEGQQGGITAQTDTTMQYPAQKNALRIMADDNEMQAPPCLPAPACQHPPLCQHRLSASTHARTHARSHACAHTEASA